MAATAISYVKWPAQDVSVHEQVPRLGLGDAARMAAVDARQRQVLVHSRRARRHHDQTGRGHNVCLGRLRVVQAAVDEGAVRHAHNQGAAVERAMRAEA